jgi:hypothetical protein
MEGPSSSVVKLDTTEKLQAFVESLPGKMPGRPRRTEILKKMAAYDKDALQYFELLATASEGRQLGRGFCKVVAVLLRGWASEETQADQMSVDEVEKALLAAWASNNAGMKTSMIPASLRAGMKQEFRKTLEAAEKVLGRWALLLSA